jgi:hypothetical protein
VILSDIKHLLLRLFVNLTPLIPLSFVRRGGRGFSERLRLS